MPTKAQWTWTELYRLLSGKSRSLNKGSGKGENLNLGTSASNPSMKRGGVQVLLWPGGSGGTRGKHRPGSAELGEPTQPPPEEAGRPWPPPPPRRNQRLVIPSGPSGPPGYGIYLRLRRTMIRRVWPPVTDWLPGEQAKEPFARLSISAGNKIRRPAFSPLL